MEEKDELTMCPMCDAGLKRQKVLIIGGIENDSYIIKKILEKWKKLENMEVENKPVFLEDKDENVLLLEDYAALELKVLALSQDPPDYRNDQEIFLAKKQKYNKRRKR